MESLVRKRGRVKAKITRIEKFIFENMDESNINTNDIAVRETLLTKAFDEYNLIQEQIEEIDDSQDDDRVEVEQKYITIHSKIKTLMANNGQAASVASGVSGVADNLSNTQGAQASTSRKLNRLNLKIPTFTGNYEEWQSFIDLFSALIDKDDTLADSEKLMYLKTVIKGEPLSIINEIKITDDNYKTALDLLKERFDRSLDIVNSHIRGLVELQITKGNPKSLREFITKVKQHTQALQNLNIPVDSWDLILINIFSSKLDFYTRNAFELSRDDKNYPTLKEFLKFLEKRCSSFELAKGREHKSAQEARQEGKQRTSHTNTMQSLAVTSGTGTKGSNELTCIFCELTNHRIYKCIKFIALPIKDKREFIWKNKLCYNCLGANHTVNQCNSNACRQCGGKHHSLLHEVKKNNQEGNDQSQTEVSFTEANHETTKNATVNRTALVAHGSSYQILLATAKVPLITAQGKIIQARALLDSASQTSFITTNLCKQLNLNTYMQVQKIAGIANNETQIEKAVDVVIGSNLDNNFKIKTSCSVLNEITYNLPHTTIEKSKLNIPEHLKLADPSFHSPGQIDLLLGAEVYFDTLKSGLIKLGPNLPILQNTSLGWLIAGTVPHSNFVTNLSIALCTQQKDLNELIPRFWQMEEVISKRFLSPEDKVCEQIFLNSTKRLENGSFQVNLPLRSDNEHLRLGNSYKLAAQRFFSLERRLLKDKILYAQYKQFIDEYVALGHGKYVNFRENVADNVSQKCFLPHHCVIRELSTTTRLRVVFDASMKTSSGVSLNDIMYKGFTVQPDLFDILCRFRMYKYVFTADIQKMYRMIVINPKQRVLQNILWRNDENETLKCIELQTVTYGTKSAPYLATRCLKQLAEDEYQRYPLASNAILYQCYVDDILCGSNSKSEISELKEQLIKLLGSGGFTLHKWCSNNKFLLDMPTNNLVVEIRDDNCSSKVLGLSWNPVTDKFKFTIPEFKNSQSYTKRQVLSSISQMFDPLGLIGPVIVISKIIMQQIWVRKVDWDEILPPDILKKWLALIEDISTLTNLEVPRWLFSFHNIIRIELHGFSDASLVAYGACIFIRGIYTNKTVSINLLCSKSRIAPLKTVSLPRLELCGALLLARLLHKIGSVIFEKIDKVVLWTDSSIVLSWLNSSPSRWTTFVANRVAEIHELTTNFEWRHIESNKNPADYLSRGLNPTEIITKRQWWEGPDFLQNHDFDLTKGNKEVQILDKIPEERKVVHTHTITQSTFPWSRFSNFSRLQRSVAYCLRFLNNTRKGTEKFVGPLSVRELRSATLKIIKCIQRENFLTEISELKKNNGVTRNTIRMLNPFIDEDDILRVNGRLANANIHYNQKYPILLPSRNYVARLLIKLEHIKLYHAGPQTVLANLRQNYWIIHGLREVKSVIKECIICHRFKAESANQLMSALPIDRISPARPFSKVGIDFGGPILVKQSHLRKSVTTKAYFALFVCMVTKAIHLELVSSLTTDAFLLTLKRFIARRGHPDIIYSDNATNFRSANTKLQELYTFFKVKKNLNSIHNFLSPKEIQWKFIPPNSPHWGGLWEAGIKSTKHHLRRVVGNTCLTFEELTTVLAQIEAILNSRPICALSTDPSDFSCLTPAHFLVGEPLMSYPEKDVTTVPESRLSFWQRVVKIQQHFWQRWSVEYLNRLQNRPKWYKTCTNLQENTIVLVKEDNVPPLKWSLARILKVIPSRDKKVRLVELKTQNGVFKRPITKLCPLPFSQ